MFEWLVALGVKLLVMLIKVVIVTLLAAVTPGDDQNEERHSEPNESARAAPVVLPVEIELTQPGQAPYLAAHLPLRVGSSPLARQAPGSES